MYGQRRAAPIAIGVLLPLLFISNTYIFDVRVYCKLCKKPLS